MNVLLSNDDGIYAPGLRALCEALKEAGHNVQVVAPMRQQSGVSHALTVFEPLRIAEIKDGDFNGIGVFGTPADCVKLALSQLMEDKPDIVMAGINQGPNAGPDIFYSGTVGAAAEGAHDNVPSIAVSHANHRGCDDILDVARHAVGLAEKLDWGAIPPGRVINVNYPDRKISTCPPIRVCPQSQVVWGNAYNRRDDPRGLPYWWLLGELKEEALGEDSDRFLLGKGYITVTPLKFEYTDDKSMDILRGMAL